MDQIHTEDVALFTDTSVNTAEDHISWIEHGPSYMERDGSSTVQFQIPGNATEYIDLGRTNIYLRIKIVKDDGTPFAVDERNDRVEFATPINGILHSMWSGVDIHLNKTLVCTSGTNYTYKTIIENTLNYSRETIKNQLGIIGMTVDERNFDARYPKDGVNSAGEIVGVNNGLIHRMRLFKDDVGEFVGPLQADICNQGKLILNGVDVDITFTPNKDQFRLMTYPDDLKCKILIEQMNLSVCKVRVAPGVLIGHGNMLNHRNAKYPYQRTEIRTYAIPAQNMSDTIENVYKGVIPSKLIVGFVDQSAFHGDFKSNPLKFDHFNISNIALTIDGIPTPKKGLALDIDNDRYLEAIIALYRTTGKLWEDTDIVIDRDTWKQGLALFAYDIDPTAAPDLRYIGVLKFGHTRLVFSFKEKLERSIMVVMYAVFPSRLEIDQARNVTIIEAKEILDEIVNKK